MYQGTSKLFDLAVRAPNTRVITASHQNLITATSNPLKIKDGSITVDATTAPRRSLSLSLPNEQAVWDLLDTYGAEIPLRAGVRYVDRTEETVPMGTFIVDSNQIDYNRDGSIELTCPDRWLKVTRNNFGLNRASVPANPVWQEIVRLVEGAWPGALYPFPGWSFVDKSATNKVGQLVWEDGDRAAAIKGLCDTNGLETFFDADGKAVLRKTPLLTPNSTPVFTVDASDSGVLMSAQRTRDLSAVRNALIITTSATDVTFAPVEVKNTTAGDPLSVTGPLGYVPEEWSSPNFRNSDQARAAGLVRLAKNLGVAKQLSISSAVHYGLDAQDVLSVLLPRLDKNLTMPFELQMIDSATFPILPDGRLDIQTRSTRPSTDGT